MISLTVRRSATTIAVAAGLIVGTGGAVLAQSCPDIGLGGARLDYAAGQLAGGLSFDVVAGGNIDLGACGSAPGFGWIIEGPDFELFLAGSSPGESITFRVSGQCDTVLLINNPSGEWFFNDDDVSLDPAITLEPTLDGVYDIWVGTYGQQTCPAVLTLQTSAAGGGGGAAPSK
jgi:hypothetical protein